MVWRISSRPVTRTTSASAAARSSSASATPEGRAPPGSAGRPADRPRPGSARRRSGARRSVGRGQAPASFGPSPRDRGRVRRPGRGELGEAGRVGLEVGDRPVAEERLRARATRGSPSRPSAARRRGAPATPAGRPRSVPGSVSAPPTIADLGRRGPELGIDRRESIGDGGGVPLEVTAGIDRRAEVRGPGGVTGERGPGAAVGQVALEGRFEVPVGLRPPCRAG